MQYGVKDNARHDAQVLYRRLMEQSRLPDFYQFIADDYDGRTEMLALHISLTFCALYKHGDQGKVLAQAVYDVMVEDFDIALREQSLSDTAVMKRIKPLAQMVLSRTKSYGEALDKVADEREKHIYELIKKYLCANVKYDHLMHCRRDGAQKATLKAIHCESVANKGKKKDVVEKTTIEKNVTDIFYPYIIHLNEHFETMMLGDFARANMTFPVFHV